MWVGTAGGDVVVAPRLPHMRDSAKASDGAFRVVVLSHHEEPAESIFQRSAGCRVWTCGRDGVVATWDAATLQLCDGFSMQASSVTSLVAMPAQLLTQLWGVDSDGSVTAWDVTEPAPEHTSTTTTSRNLADSSKPLSNAGNEYEQMVSHLASLLAVSESDASDAMKRHYVVPTAIEDAYPDAAYLPDAVMSLTDCRFMLAQSFADLGWESKSFNEDLFLVLSNLATKRRMGERAVQVATSLTRLCPFPLPSSLVDPFDKLITAAECLLEEVADKGVVEDPDSHHRRAQSSGKKPSSSEAAPSTPEGQRQSRSLDDSGTPQPTQSLHVYETQLRALDADLEDVRRTVKDTSVLLSRSEAQCRLLEDENDELRRFLDVFKRKEAQLEDDLERAEKARLGAKKASERSHVDVTRLDEQVSRMRESSAEMEIHLRKSEASQLQLAKELSAKDDLVQELMVYVKQQGLAIDELTERSKETQEEIEALREDVGLYQSRETKGKRLLAASNWCFDETQNSLREILEDMRDERLFDRAALAKRVDDLLAQLQQRISSARSSIRGDAPAPAGSSLQQQATHKHSRQQQVPQAEDIQHRRQPAVTRQHDAPFFGSESADDNPIQSKFF